MSNRANSSTFHIDHKTSIQHFSVFLLLGIRMRENWKHWVLQLSIPVIRILRTLTCRNENPFTYYQHLALVFLFSLLIVINFNEQCIMTQHISVYLSCQGMIWVLGMNYLSFFITWFKYIFWLSSISFYFSLSYRKE